MSDDAEGIAGVRLTHPGRALYPEQGITKAELAAYYQETADWILPHVEGRPLTLVRCPEGRRKECFYQRHSRDAGDKAIHTVRIKNAGSSAPYLWIDSLRGLIALVQMGVLEIHTWGSRVERLERPDRLTFDLDPDPVLPWQSVNEAANELRARLSALGLAAFVKTTGGKGLHVVVPLIPKTGWNLAKDFSRAVAQSMAREAPDRYVATMSKAKRKRKIFVDYLRNQRTASAVCAYSTRARTGAPVSVPVAWDELKADLREQFTLRSVPPRLAALRKDPWDGYEAARRPLTSAMLKRI